MTQMHIIDNDIKTEIIITFHVLILKKPEDIKEKDERHFKNKQVKILKIRTEKFDIHENYKI